MLPVSMVEVPFEHTPHPSPSLPKKYKNQKRPINLQTHNIPREKDRELTKLRTCIVTLWS